jgi:flagellin-specific chaperone FliS
VEGSAGNSYLLTAIRTAEPPKLHLMLIEAAIRFCQRAREQFQGGPSDQGTRSVSHASEVVTQLLADLDPSTEAARNLAGVYLFLLKTLGDVTSDRAEKLLGNVLRVLEIERETWRLVCEKSLGAAAPPRHVVPPPLGPMNSFAPQSGFSVEA